MALGDSGSKDEAKYAFSKAIEFDPNNKAWPFTLAYIYLQEKNFEESAKLYERVVEIDPEFGMAWQFLVSIYRELGDAKKRENAVLRMAILITQGKMKL
ncbi:MAG: tetratricopeptide repeat protein [Candidatus Thorarchaeota archaeon]|nr:MAG: tetratricopeptide repeat protein [Candidatus Thorarchaeota archaeon]